MPDLRERFRSLDRLPAPDLWSEVADRAQAPQKTNWAFAFGAAAIVLLAVVIGLQLRSGALVGGPGPSETASPGTSVGPTPSAGPSPSVQPSTEPSPSSDLPQFFCGVAFRASAPSTGIAHLVDVRLGTHDGYDRIVFEYDSDTLPRLYGYEPADPPYVRDPSGLPMTVDGSEVYRILIEGATKMGEDGQSTYDGSTDFHPDFPQVAHLVESGDFEAFNTWYLGANGGRCLRIFHLTDPNRLVFDVKHLPNCPDKTLC